MRHCADGDKARLERADLSLMKVLQVYQDDDGWIQSARDELSAVFANMGRLESPAPYQEPRIVELSAEERAKSYPERRQA